VLRGGSALTAVAQQALASPYAESELLLGGYFQIDVASDADAVASASKMPAVSGVIEVRSRYTVPGTNM
jgi:hypothetical protein